MSGTEQKPATPASVSTRPATSTELVGVALARRYFDTTELFFRQAFQRRIDKGLVVNTDELQLVRANSNNPSVVISRSYTESRIDANHIMINDIVNAPEDAELHTRKPVFEFIVDKKGTLTEDPTLSTTPAIQEFRENYLRTIINIFGEAVNETGSTIKLGNTEFISDGESWVLKPGIIVEEPRGGVAKAVIKEGYL